MQITELENNSESVWIQVFANKTSHFVANWYHQPPGSKLEDLMSELGLFKSQLEKIKSMHKGNNPTQSMLWGTSTSEILFGQTDSTNQAYL